MMRQLLLNNNNNNSTMNTITGYIVYQHNFDTHTLFVFCFLLSSYPFLACSSSRGLQGFNNIHPTVSPSDPSFSTQTYLGSPTEHFGGLNAQKAWTLSTGSNVQPVALLSSRCVPSPVSLPNNELPFPRIQSVPLPAFAASSGQTGLASIMAATTSNALGIAGICWECVVLCVAVRDSTTAITADSISQGLQVVIDNNIRIAVIAEGITPVSINDISVLQAAIDRARTAGVLVIAGPGQPISGSPCNIDTLECSPGSSPIGYYPGKLTSDNLLVVGQFRGVGKQLSNIGSLSVDIFTGAIIPPVPVDAFGNSLPSPREFAVAFAGAVVSVIWGMQPCWGYRQVKDVIINVACNCVSPATDPSIYNGSACGGTLDMYKAVSYAKHHSCQPRTHPLPLQWVGNFYSQLSSLKSLAKPPAATTSTAKSCTAIIE
eukprot:GHVS01031671.1.p1 GENE.GHVS01031671.1~~GHVS01031671.1.p1  ORF type:complete len:431 (-),score=38.57 GHVS01031671.1:719-2011(-)